VSGRSRTGESGRKALRFTHVHLENWRNFARVDTHLQRRVFLVGPNASGKSNFLDAFRFVREVAAVGGGLAAAVRNRGGVSRLRCLAARRYPDIVIRVTVGTDETPSIWEYELSFGQDNLRRPIVKREKVFHGHDKVLDRPQEREKSDPERLTQTHLEQVVSNQEFRDVAEFFRSIRYLHIVPQLIRDVDRSLGKQNDPYGGDFLEQVASRPEKTRRAWLARIQSALRVAVPQLQDLDLERDARGAPHLKARYGHWRSRGAWQSEEEFSDGTLRLLGLLWSVLEGTGPLLLEEPELSLHPEVVRFIPQLLAGMQRRSGRQVIASTHSSDLLRGEGIGLDEVLLLKPEEEGTAIQAAGEFGEIRALLEAGLSLDDAVLPHTRPQSARQLTFFGD
jgi:predicted ATPase